MSLLELNKRIEKERMAKGMSQRALARAADLSSMTISKIESGESCNPTIWTVKKIAKVLGVSIGYLAGEE